MIHRAARILYVMDDASRNGGAHMATRSLISELVRKGLSVDVLCTRGPTCQQQKNTLGVRFFIFAVRSGVIKRVAFGLWRRLLPCYSYPDWLIDPFYRVRKLMTHYDVVCVMSEESLFRGLVSRLPKNVRKVQLVHTNYAQWKEMLGLSIRDDDIDHKIYKRMDRIGVVGHIGAVGFAAIFPECKDKVSPFYNLINVVAVNKKRDCQTPIRIITVARLEDKRSKDGRRVINIASKLKQLGIDFDWHVYGCGENRVKEYQEYANEVRVEDCFHVHGFDGGISDKLAESDVMLLLSHYEGLPNVIYESFSVGTPVFSTNVGGISEQIQDGINGWLTPDDEGSILEKLMDVLQNPKAINIARQNLIGYKYDNEKALRSHLDLLGIN